jgi:hypothetical protein
MSTVLDPRRYDSAEFEPRRLTARQSSVVLSLFALSLLPWIGLGGWLVWRAL